MSIKYTLDELHQSDAYANFIMDHPDDRPICNGDMLLEAMEDGYLFDEFLASIGYEQ
jgi:hypothetical protein